MSAFLCPYTHLNAILHFHRYIPPHNQSTDLRIYPLSGMVVLGGWHEETTWEAAGKLLYDENCRSLKARYQGRAEETNEPFNPALIFTPALVRRLSAIEAIKACECYNYQACETKDYYDTAAKALINQIIGHAHKELPGYDKAAWGDQSERFNAAPTPVKVAPALVVTPTAPSRIKLSILERADKSTKRPYALAASNIRKTLKHIWPEVKFSVTSSSFSMGDDVHISWTDGPLARDVNDIAKQWEAGSFDGMDDSYNYARTTLNETYGKTKYVITSRKVSTPAPVTA